MDIAVDGPSMALETVSATSPPKMTMKQRTLAHGVAEGLSVAEAGRAAGIVHRQSAHEMFRNLRDRLLVDFDGVGITTRTIALKIKEKLDAKETKLFAKDGVITDAIDLEAHGIQLDAAKLAADLMGLTSDRNATSIGTVNVMFAGALPDWMTGQPQPDAVAQRATVDAMPAPNGNSANIVHTDSRADAPPPLSTVEGTDSDGGGIAQTHPANFAGTNRIDTVPVEVAPAKAKLVSRVTRKRQARLPVFKGGS